MVLGFERERVRAGNGASIDNLLAVADMPSGVAVGEKHAPALTGRE